MFLKNCWYVAAYDRELEDGGPLGRKLLDEPVVIFRDSKGTPVALEDRCCHRQLPLSLGAVTGDTLQCGYHGLEFDATGACVTVPGQSMVPPGTGRGALSFLALGAVGPRSTRTRILRPPNSSSSSCSMA